MKSFDVELAKQQSKKKQQTIFRAFLDDFERQQFDLSERTKDDLEGRKWIVGTLYTFDMLLCYCIIGPLVVAFWRGTWGMYDHVVDHLVFRDNYATSNGYCLFLGSIFCLLIVLFHHNLRERAGGVGSLRQNILRHVFSLLWGFSDILFWKGIVVDQEEEHIHADTVLNSRPGDPVLTRIADGVLSRVMEAGVVLLWHGVWSFMDLVLEDEQIGLGLHHNEAGLASLTAGWLAGPLILLLHLPLLSLSISLPLESKLLHCLSLLFTLFNTIVTIACFRGAWHLLDVHLLPEEGSDHVTLLSLVVGWVIGLLGLVAFRCISCLHAGAFRDSPEDGITVTFHLTSFLYVHHKENTETAKNQL